jgi:hypothetical protein
MDKALITSPNPRVLCNHQVEICEALGDSFWTVYDEETFVDALAEAVQFVREGGRIEVPEALKQASIEPLAQIIRAAIGGA